MVGDRISDFEGGPYVELKNSQLSLWLSEEFGPRIMGLFYKGGENWLAVLPEARIAVDGGEDYSLRGGHRLWYAPELPETTYLTDDLPPRIQEVDGGLEAIQKIDQPTGIQKSWQVRLDGEAPRLMIDHRLTNLGEAPFELAPWALTMARPGGVGLLPLQTEREDKHGLWPNRQLVFWPYTDLNSPHLKIINQGAFVRADLSAGALKIGIPNPSGWLAYRQNGCLFVKKSRYQKGKHYLDMGTSHQIYCNPDVIELETLGPVVDLAPGESVEHQEVWQIYPEGSWPSEIQAIFDLLD